MPSGYLLPSPSSSELCVSSGSWASTLAIFWRLVNFGNYVDGTKIEDQDSYIRNRSGSHAKFDTYSRSITTSPNIWIKIVLYLVSWLLKTIAVISTKIMKKKKRINKLVFYFVYYHQKLHFGILNTFISQGVLLTTRTITHTKLVPTDFWILIDKIISIICLFLLSIDYYLLFSTVLDYRARDESISQLLPKKSKN